MTTHTPGPTRNRAEGYPAPTHPPGLASAAPAGALAPAPTVLRAAPRRRASQRGVLLSLLVVLVGGLLAFAGAQMLTHHTLVLAVAHDVPVGAKITADDLTTASVTADPNLSPIPATQREQVVGLVAQVGLVKGELLVRTQLGAGSGFGAGQVMVALPLKVGQFPGQGVAPGQHVLIVATPGSGGAGSTSSGVGGSGAVDGSVRSSGVPAVVASISAADLATQVTVVDVRVASDVGVEVAQLASTGNLALVLLPQGS